MTEGVALYGSSASTSVQRDSFRSGAVPVAVYGLGKMGLPLAGVYAERCGAVTGVDIDPTVVDDINAGNCHISGEPGLASLIAEQTAADRLRATTDGNAAAAAARVHVIIVPTLLNSAQEPDLSLIEDVLETIATGLEPGDLVIAESTLPPGTCREAIVPTLADESGLEPDTFGVAFCPERTASGRALADIRGQYPKVVGGVNAESTRAAALLYSELTTNEVHVVSDATTAEAVKVFEGVYRDVNIALVNELARATDDLGISLREAIATANELPMCDLHDPGPGVGGHCIPYYPHFVLAQTDRQLAVTRQARETNESMPAYTVSLLEAGLADRGIDIESASIAVLGITYRPGVEETRSSPALGVINRLEELGADVFGLDPMVDPADYGATPVACDSFAEASFDGAILVTPHEAFDRLAWDAAPSMVVVDGRDALALEESHHQCLTLGGQRGERPIVLESGVSQSRSRSRSQPDAQPPSTPPSSRPDGGETPNPGDPNV